MSMYVSWSDYAGPDESLRLYLERNKTLFGSIVHTVPTGRTLTLLFFRCIDCFLCRFVLGRPAKIRRSQVEVDEAIRDIHINNPANYLTPRCPISTADRHKALNFCVKL